MKPIIVTLTVLSMQWICLGQTDQFDFFNTSRFSRVISLGNAFTGLADDIEAVYYNSAGIADLDYYGAIYASGQGSAFVINDYTAVDLAIIIPAFSKLGIFAFSVDRLNIIDDSFRENIYRLHFARNLFTGFSAGTSLNYYHFRYESSRDVIVGSSSDFTGNAFDLSLSALYKLPLTLIPGVDNETRFGMQMQNVLDTDVHYSGDVEKEPKHQVLRSGLSIAFVPEMQKLNDLTPIKFIIVADAVFFGSGYKFNLFQPNYGLELALFEVIKVRYGRENEEVIGDAYEYSPQHPVHRYGFGLTLPLHQLFTGAKRLELSFDYSYSNWDQIDESQPILPWISKDLPVRDSFSLKLCYQN